MNRTVHYVHGRDGMGFQVLRVEHTLDEAGEVVARRHTFLGRVASEKKAIAACAALFTGLATWLTNDGTVEEFYDLEHTFFFDFDHVGQSVAA